MTAEPSNVLLIMSDEHRPDALGCAGHPFVRTPALDRLTASGTRFSSAYCASPLCVPSRASFATGRYVFETGFWDNATPYNGEPRSWGHRFADHGIPVTTIGKLDFEPGVDDGFADQRLADHRDSPDLYGLHRDPPRQRERARERILAAGPTVDGEAWYVDVEEARTRAAIEFLETRADDDEPWVCWLNYILPHFPLRVERKYYDRYPPDAMSLPEDYPAGDDHPILDELRHHFDGRDVDEDALRRTRAAYFGLCSALDDHIGRVLDALDRLELADETLVIYAGDHGEPLGDHEIWWKCCMYEASVGTPIILRGPGVVEGAVLDGHVSLLDVVPTMAQAVGVEPDSVWRGQSLLPLARGQADPDPDRAILSEYHAHGTSHGMFMLRAGRYKYVHYPENPAQLFDLESDPGEIENLAADPEYAAVRTRLEGLLRNIVDPESIDRRALAEQRTRLETEE